MFLYDENMNMMNKAFEDNFDEVIMEGLLEDAGMAGDEESIMALYESGILSERSIVKLDKSAHKGRAEKKTIITMARQNNDPLYKKLVKVYKMKKFLIGKLEKKYGMKAKAEVRKFKFNAKGKVPMTTSGKDNVKVAKAIKKVLDKNSVKKSKDI